MPNDSPGRPNLQRYSPISVQLFVLVKALSGERFRRSEAPRPFKEERLAGPCNRGSSSYTKTYKFTQPKVVRATYRGRRDLSSGEEYLWRSTFRHYGYAGARAVTSCEEGYLVRRHYYDRPIHRDVYYYQWILTVSGPSYGKWKKAH